MTILTINTIPPSPNVLRRKYRTPHAYKKLRAAFEWELFSVPSRMHRERLQQQAKCGKMWVEMTVHHTKLYDMDNLQGSYKPILDALVNIGFLSGDSPDRLQLLPAKQILCGKSEIKTIVRIGALD